MSERQDVTLFAETAAELPAAVCALLNASGGRVCLRRFKDGEKLSFDAVKPSAPVFRVRDGEVGGCPVFEIPEGRDKPYSVDGCFYCLAEGKITKADGELVREMLLASKMRPLRWERQLSELEDVKTFNRSEIDSFVEAVGCRTGDGIVKALADRGYFRRGKFTNAADVLLADDVAIRNPQVRIRAVLCGEKSDREFGDYQVFDGALLPMFEQAWFFILRNMSKSVGFGETGVQREVLFQYPPPAVREGLINALAHRDYEEYGGGVRIELKRDSLSIWNAGSLMEGVSIENLSSGFRSVLRNPDIANYLNIRRYMEMVGRGGPLIVSACRKAGLPDPRWEIDGNGVRLTFFAKKGGAYIDPEERSVLVNDTMPFSLPDESRPSWWPKTWPKTWPKMWPKMWPMTNENKILSLLYFEASSKKCLAERIGIKPGSNSFKIAISSLLSAGFVEQTIKDRPKSKLQKYRMTESGREFLMRGGR